MNKWIERNRVYILKFLMFLGLYLIFRGQILELYGFISTLITFKSSSFKIGYILIILVLSLLYASKFDKKFNFSWQFNLGVALVIFIYILERLLFNDILFLPQSTFIKYADFIIFFLIIHFIVLINSSSNRLKSKLSNEIKLYDGQNFFIEDKTFDGEIDNELILENLLGRLKDFMPESSFSIGINASWGYGKSTFLNRFYHKYKEENKEGIIFWYNIWRNKDSGAIIDNFFSELSNNLSPYSGEISNEINKYVNAILHITPGEIGKVIEAGKSIFFKENSLEVHVKLQQNVYQLRDKFK